MLDAVNFVADNGAALMADYHFDPRTGLWVHRLPREAPMSLHDIAYGPHGIRYEDHRRRLGSVPLRRFIDEAADIVAAHRAARAAPLPPPDTTDDFEHLRWFPYPAEALADERTARRVDEVLGAEKAFDQRRREHLLGDGVLGPVTGQRPHLVRDVGPNVDLDAAGG